MKEKLFRILMQFLKYFPKLPSEPYCFKKLWTIRSFESLEKHNCFHKGKFGLPCKNLIWVPYQGLAINLQLLRFMGWEKSRYIEEINQKILQSRLPKKMKEQGVKND